MLEISLAHFPKLDTYAKTIFNKFIIINFNEMVNLNIINNKYN